MKNLKPLLFITVLTLLFAEASQASHIDNILKSQAVKVRLVSSQGFRLVSSHIYVDDAIKWAPIEINKGLNGVLQNLFLLFREQGIDPSIERNANGDVDLEKCTGISKDDLELIVTSLADQSFDFTFQGQDGHIKVHAKSIHHLKNSSAASYTDYSGNSFKQALTHVLPNDEIFSSAIIESARGENIPSSNALIREQMDNLEKKISILQGNLDKANELKLTSKKKDSISLELAVTASKYHRLNRDYQAELRALEDANDLLSSSKEGQECGIALTERIYAILNDPTISHKALNLQEKDRLEKVETYEALIQQNKQTAVFFESDLE